MATPRLSLPTIATAQAQKEVTHNEALLLLDALVQGAIEHFAINTPPHDPHVGQAWIAGDTPTGAWAGASDHVAVWTDGGWRLIAPQVGMTLWDKALGGLRLYRDGAWTIWAPGVLQNLHLLGVGTTADSANPLSVKGSQVLFAAKSVGEGGNGDLRVVLNKATKANTASLLFQDGYSGRAELGLAGDDAFRLKVSADGGAWITALTVDPRTGSLSLASAGGVTLALPFGDTAGNTLIDASRHLRLRSYTRAALPVPSVANLGWAEVTDPESGKGLLVHNNGTAWIYADNTTVTIA